MILVKALLIVLLAVSAVHCALDRDRIMLVDKKDDLHFLFRGNMPIEDNKFQYEELKTALDELSNTTGYRIVVVTLLNFLTAKETKNRYI